MYWIVLCLVPCFFSYSAVSTYCYISNVYWSLFATFMLAAGACLCWSLPSITEQQKSVFTGFLTMQYGLWTRHLLKHMHSPPGLTCQLSQTPYILNVFLIQWSWVMVSQSPSSWMTTWEHLWQVLKRISIGEMALICKCIGRPCLEQHFHILLAPCRWSTRWLLTSSRPWRSSGKLLQH